MDSESYLHAGWVHTYLLEKPLSSIRENAVTVSLGFRGDVVIVRSPENPRGLICKRIAAMVGIHFSIFKRNCIQHSDNVKLFAHTAEFHEGPGLLIHIYCFH